jgi:hypothetical protein
MYLNLFKMSRRGFQTNMNRHPYGGISEQFNSSGGIFPQPPEDFDVKETREERLIRQQYEQMLRKEEKEQRKKDRMRLQKMDEGQKETYNQSSSKISQQHPSVLGNQ